MNQPRSCGGRFARVYADDLHMATPPTFPPRLSARVKQDELDVRRNARFVEDRDDESSMRECLEQSRGRIAKSGDTFQRE